MFGKIKKKKFEIIPSRVLCPNSRLKPASKCKKTPKPVQGLQISSLPIFTNISLAMCEPVQGPVQRSVLHKDRKAASGVSFS